MCRLESERRGGRQVVDERPEDDFRDIPAYPVTEDLTRKPKLRRNFEHGSTTLEMRNDVLM